MAEPAPRGRPRSPAAHQAILRATRLLIVESGYSGLSMERVALRAGVGKQTVYRRWAAKPQLVAEAILDAYGTGDRLNLVDSGDVLADLGQWLRGAVAFFDVPGNADLVRSLAAAAAENPQDSAALYDRLTGPQYEAIMRRLQTAVDAGQVRADIDLADIADALLGATLYRVLAHSGPVRAGGLIDALIVGAATPGMRRRLASRQRAAAAR